MERSGSPISGSGKATQPMGELAPLESKSTKGRSLQEKIKEFVNRIFYALNNISYSMKQIRPGKALSLRADNPAFKNVQSVKEESGNNIIYPQGVKGNPYGINSNLPKGKTEGYFTFNLPTTHKVMGVKKESHNVSVLYDAKNKQLYVIDGKANKPSKLHFEDFQKNQRNETVQDFVDYLKSELDVEDVAFCKTALQRTNDCVIFPEKVMADLINDKSTGSAETRLDNVLEKAKTDTDAFYGEINTIRDQCFKKKSA